MARVAVCLILWFYDMPICLRMPPQKRDAMTKADVWKLQPDDLRRIAARAQEPERERKILALAEQLESKDPQHPYRRKTRG